MSGILTATVDRRAGRPCPRTAVDAGGTSPTNPRAGATLGASPARTRTRTSGWCVRTSARRSGHERPRHLAFRPSVAANGGAVAAQYETHGEVGPRFRRYFDDGAPGGRKGVGHPWDDRPRVAPLGACAVEGRGSPHGESVVERRRGLGVRVRRPLGANRPTTGTCLVDAVMLDATVDAPGERPPTAVTLDIPEAGNGAGTGVTTIPATPQCGLRRAARSPRVVRRPEVDASRTPVGAPAGLVCAGEVRPQNLDTGYIWAAPGSVVPARRPYDRCGTTGTLRSR